MDDLPQTLPIKISRELLQTLFTRDEQCNRLRLEVTGPDDEGFYGATVTVDQTDNPLDVAEWEIRSLLAQPLAVEKGKIYVLECPESLRVAEIQAIAARWESTIGAEPVVLTGGLRVARRELGGEQAG